MGLFNRKSQEEKDREQLESMKSLCKSRVSVSITGYLSVYFDRNGERLSNRVITYEEYEENNRKLKEWEKELKELANKEIDKINSLDVIQSVSNNIKGFLDDIQAKMSINPNKFC